MSEETFGPEHFAKLLARDHGILDRLEKESLARDVPIVGPSMGRLLYVLARAANAKSVLELGTANGYSTIWLARAVGSDGHLTTIEWSRDMAVEAEKNLSEAGVEEQVDIIVSDALPWLAKASEKYDLIFMDIEKEMYSLALPHCVKLLKPGGMLLCDNVAFKTSGTFNEDLLSNPLLETSFVYGIFHNHAPDEDALSISVKKRGK